MTISQKKIQQLRENGVRVYDPDCRGDCPFECVEQLNFVSWLRFNYPHIIAFHPVNESDIPDHKRKSLISEGMLPGASDIIILHQTEFNPFCVIEMKRQNIRKSSISQDQINFLVNSASVGGFAAVACGSESAKQAFLDFISC